MSKLFQARFATTVNDTHCLPATPLREVAFAGRSNAGKSSAINVLCNQKRLAFASKTPGRTQHINYFGLFAKDDLLAYLVDLPGYGYAAVNRETKYHWNALLSDYLQERDQLVGMVLIVDSRRGITDLDEQMIQWFVPTGKPIHILLSKCDKLNKSECKHAIEAVRKQLQQYDPALPGGTGDSNQLTAQLFSSTKRIGLEEADNIVIKWLFEAGTQKDEITN
jgi:GTP-binding protein